MAPRARRVCAAWTKAPKLYCSTAGPFVSFANCGLPYYVGDVIREEAKLLLLATPGLFRERFNIEVRTRNEVTAIDRQACDVPGSRPGDRTRLS